MGLFMYVVFLPFCLLKLYYFNTVFFCAAIHPSYFLTNMEILLHAVPTMGYMLNPPRPM
jgi:hypothetical protein